MIAMSIPREGTAKWEGPVPPFVQYALEHRERGELTPELGYKKPRWGLKPVSPLGFKTRV